LSFFCWSRSLKNMESFMLLVKLSSSAISLNLWTESLNKCPLDKLLMSLCIPSFLYPFALWCRGRRCCWFDQYLANFGVKIWFVNGKIWIKNGVKMAKYGWNHGYVLKTYQIVEHTVDVVLILFRHCLVQDDHFDQIRSHFLLIHEQFLLFFLDLV
jgi:hypothetical protein